MIQASTAFNEAVAKSGRTFRARIIADGSAVDCEVMHATIRKGASDARQFLVGAVYSSSCEITVANLTDYLVGRDIALQIGVLTDETTVDYITVGVFTVASVRKNDGAQVINAQGAISTKLSDALPTVTTQTLASVAAAITSATGATITFDTGINTSGVITAPLQNMSCRSALALLAFLVGGYATEDASGGIVIKKYVSNYSLSILVDSADNELITDGGAVFVLANEDGAVETVTVLAEDCLQAPIVHESDFDMTGVKVIVNEEYETENEDGESVIIPETSFTRGTVRQVYTCEYMTAQLFNDFADNIVGYAFMPAEVDMSLGDPRLEPWDILHASDISGAFYNVPCHYIEATFDGGYSCKVIASGESEVEDVPEGAVTQALNSMQTQIYSAAASAATAHDAAQSAKQDAADAAQAAADAQTSADNAQSAADTAQGAAESATTSANSALIQLSTVESVVGTLEWISKHGTYELTDDTSALDGKLYFAKVGDSYVVQTLADDADPQALGLYELASVDEAVTSYIASHLALTDEGLSIVNDQQSGRALFSTDGVTIFNASGDPVAVYGEKTVLGNKDGLHIEIDPTIPQLGFYAGNSATTDPVAYISNDQLWIPRAVVVDSMQVGNNSEGGAWQWSIDKTTRNLRLVWIGEQ